MASRKVKTLENLLRGGPRIIIEPGLFGGLRGADSPKTLKRMASDITKLENKIYRLIQQRNALVKKVCKPAGLRTVRKMTTKVHRMRDELGFLRQIQESLRPPPSSKRAR